MQNIIFLYCTYNALNILNLKLGTVRTLYKMSIIIQSKNNRRDILYSEDNLVQFYKFTLLALIWG